MDATCTITIVCPYCRERREVEASRTAEPACEIVTAAAPCIAGCTTDTDALADLTQALREQLDTAAMAACGRGRAA